MFILTPADSPFQLSQAGILTVRNSTLLDRETLPSIHLQVFKNKPTPFRSNARQTDDI